MSPSPGALSCPSFSMRAMVVLALLTFACASEPPQSSGAKPKPPPRPGSSITHSQMCSCKVCPNERCCRGETNEPEPETCKDSYDFSGACGMAVQSCTGRCAQEVWRVRLDQSCDEKRPASCCAGT